MTIQSVHKKMIYRALNVYLSEQYFLEAVEQKFGC